METNLKREERSRRKSFVKLSRKDKAKKWWADTISKLENEKNMDDEITDDNIRKHFPLHIQEMLTGIIFEGNIQQKIPLIQCEKEYDVKSEENNSQSEEFTLESLKVQATSGHTDSAKLSVETETTSLQSYATDHWQRYKEESGLTSAISLTRDSLISSSVERERKSRRQPGKDTFDFEAFREIEAEKIKVPESEYYNVYRRFLKKPPEKASIWRPKPKPTFEEMTLEEKAEEITHRIAKDFVDWMKSLSPEITLTVENIIKMFDIGGQTTLAKTFDLTLSQLSSISPKLAKLKQNPEMSRTYILDSEIQKDLEASKRQPKIFAFGSRLPATEQVLPETNDFVDQWVNQVPHGNLLTMEVTFKDIEHLRSTRGFIRYLKTQTGITPPSYLVTKGLMARESLDDSDLSSESAI